MRSWYLVVPQLHRAGRCPDSGVLVQDMGGLQELVLAGNTYRGGVQSNELINPGGVGILAKSIRIHPVRYGSHRMYVLPAVMVVHPLSGPSHMQQHLRPQM